MLRTNKILKVVMFAFGVAIALPAALSLMSSPASASGYMLASGIFDEPTCGPMGGSDC